MHTLLSIRIRNVDIISLKLLLLLPILTWYFIFFVVVCSWVQQWYRFVSLCYYDISRCFCVNERTFKQPI